MTSAELERALSQSLCTIDSLGRLIHPGLPQMWVVVVAVAMVASCTVVFMRPLRALHAIGLVSGKGITGWHLSVSKIPLVGTIIQTVTSRAWPLLLAKLIIAALFLLIILAGLYGTPFAERNAATVLTWNLWWTGLIISVFFLGSAWCAICPWDTIATLVTRHTIFKPAALGSSLNMRVPKLLRSVWPALFLLIGLTWLELGIGITLDPYATAILALVMVVLATLSLSLFERKAFCRYFCPVGRTVGAYAQLAMVELRPTDPAICATCTSLECYHGTTEVAPCPTHLVMGRLKQSTYCTSCGNCALSCPDHNVAWQFTNPAAGATQEARPHWDEAWFMLALLALTGFHGLTMLPFWETTVTNLAFMIGDSGRLLWAFSLSFAASLIAPAALFALCVAGVMLLNNERFNHSFRTRFSQFSFVALPMAFSYHIAHNLNHLILEGGAVRDVIANPFGVGALPLTNIEKRLRGFNMPISQDALNMLQAGFMIFGFMIALHVVLNRGQDLLTASSRNDGNMDYALGLLKLSPMFVFVIMITSYHVWLLMQPMVMRF